METESIGQSPGTGLADGDGSEDREGSEGPGDENTSKYSGENKNTSYLRIVRVSGRTERVNRDLWTSCVETRPRDLVGTVDQDWNRKNFWTGTPATTFLTNPSGVRRSVR